MTDQLTFTIDDSEYKEPSNLAIYRAGIDYQAVGIDSDGGVVVGMRLELVYSDGYDLLAEFISDCGDETASRISLPDDGVQPGQLYTPTMINVSTDWESGHADDWDIEMVPYNGEIPQDAAPTEN
jgi:hypothetical protein